MTQPAEKAADEHDRTGAESVHQIAFDRHQPGLGQNKDREGNLDRGPAPAVLVSDRIYEQRPAVLEIGNHRHADDAHQELPPSIERMACDIGSMQGPDRGCEWGKWDGHGESLLGALSGIRTVALGCDAGRRSQLSVQDLVSGERVARRV
jgi:hypothetical protein